MNIEQVLLLLLIAYPIYINKLRYLLLNPRLSKLFLLGPLALLSLSINSYYTNQPVLINLLFTNLKLDILSGLIATTVMTIGVIVLRFSIRYLQDDLNKEKFFNNLSFTLTSVLLMLMASNLLVLFLAWVGTSYFLHKLLTHYPERPAAMAAAMQKFWISRLGDLFIILAGLLLFKTFNTLEFQVIFNLLKNPQFINENNITINWISIFLVLGAMTKSAQFPFHKWLPNTMETPTPVSALMHAGIINAGGYLVIRTSPIISNSSEALFFLATIGGLTTFFACIVMLTQTNVKKNLAYSTISQMGFMMLQCGLGAYSTAVIHIIGHAFYKACSFLSSGSVTDYSRLNRYYPREELSHNLFITLALAMFSVITMLASLNYLGNDLLNNVGAVVLLTIVALAFSQIVLSSKDRFNSLFVALALVLTYIGLSKGMSYLLKDIVPNTVKFDGVFGVMIIAISIGFFVALYLIQNNLRKLSQTEFGRKIYVMALRGEF
jgi:NAD(P)H-quinone oxidoreductase subunit 5